MATESPAPLPLLDHRNIWPSHRKIEEDGTLWSDDPPVGVRLTVEPARKSEVFFTTQRPWEQEAGININQEVSRRDFEERIADRLDLVFEVVDRTLADAGVGPTNVDQVVLTGGSCRLPAFRRRAKSKFGPRVSERSEASRVALGLASEARRIWS